MSRHGPGLTAISTPDLEALLQAVEQDRLSCPVDRTGLISAGLGAVVEHVAILDRLDQAATISLLEAILAEREHGAGQRLELVWTGPEARISSARDTAVVIRRLLGEARTSVLIAGFCFDHGEEIFAPLHRVMREHGVTTTIFLDIAGEAGSDDEIDSFAAAAIDRFLESNWPFGEPQPTFYYDPRTVAPYARASLHAKCIVTDSRRCLISSANFTDRGQTRNIEAGALIDDRAFAGKLVQQWQGLIDSGLLRRGG
jgi:phosphatidylserine/phosphatidylglycerophosphate/cardiolipin synthase-like enzyme